MAIIRFKALEEIMSRELREVIFPEKTISAFFGEYVFDRKKMEKYLSADAFNHIDEAINNGRRVDRKVANQIAAGMAAWAIENGATHYTHWFHPLTGGTAEKHDALIEINKNNEVVERISGKMLAQQEPDASSFPSGGLRNTFEARGVTAWDPSSPAFILDGTLSIPTVFVSYNGEALDFKTPLLKSIQALDKAATDVGQYFNKDMVKVSANLGWEQEYFLIDEALYKARPDLMLTSRTLMGHASAKDQQLDDHFFSSIPPRVFAFMKEFEIEAYKLGIPLKTHHNEVSPNQFEITQLHEECNLAVDHNLMLMDLMKKIAIKHKFGVIFHEKPFKGVNGSSKHVNWSLVTDSGINLLSPGPNPKSNIQFLTFLVNTIMAVYKYQDIIRASVASASNAHRLGSDEAPPAIISVFIGSQLTRMLQELEKRVSAKKMTPDEKTELKLDIGKIPEILLDNTDSNRTSPFAFTGNRFEIRTVGASTNCAAPMIVLNTIVSDQLRNFKKEVDTLINKNVKKDEAIFQVLRKYIIESKPILFEGNNYSEEWQSEAKKRGLSNIPNVADAYMCYLNKNAIDVFKRNEVLSEVELKSRTDVRLETYVKEIQIESRVLGDLALNHIVPTAIDYQSRLVDNVKGLKEIFDASELIEVAGARKSLIKAISSHIVQIKKLAYEMKDVRKEANAIEDKYKRAKAYSDTVLPFFEKIRYHIDELEMIVDDEIWPLPKYRELLFIR